MNEVREGQHGFGERAFNAAPVALILLDIAGVIVRANPSAERLLRRSRANIVGRAADAPEWGMTTLEGAPVAPADLPFRRALLGEEPEPMAVSIASPQGQRLFLRISASPLRDSNGRVEGAVVAATDLSEVRQARDELARNRARKAYALEAANMVVWEWDPVTGCFEYSGEPLAAGRILPRAEIQAMVDPRDRDRVRAAFDAAFESGGEFHCEYRLTYEGEERWVSSRGRAVIDDAGKRRMSGVLVDITKHKKLEIARSVAQEALALSEERFRLAVEGTGAGVYDLNLETGEAMWTPNLFEMLGYHYAPGGRATKSMSLDVLHADDVEDVRSAHARSEAALGPLAVEYRIHKADTYEERWLSAYGRVYLVEGVRRAIGIVFDITRRKRAEERERLLMREVDHRAKNVLAIVRSVLQLTPHDNIESYVESVSGRIGAVARVHTLLAEKQWRSASLRALIEAELAAYRQHTGRIRISGPDAAAGPQAAQALAMIVHELATNAAKYGALSVPDGRLTITLGRENDDVTLEWVEDAPHPVSKPPELGFGSRLVATLVERQLDGAIVYDWRTNGLSVRLKFCGLGPAPAAQGVEEPCAQPELVRNGLSDRAILVVEDDALVSMALEQSLTDAGGRVRAFRTVNDALISVRRAPPELAVLDVNVRGVPVTPVAAELLQRGVPFVYATGYSDDLAELPGAAVVHKPFAAEDVRIALEALVATS
jgi:PAS domain S-box-containing protein